MNPNAVLQHFGIKGMKWGHRRAGSTTKPSVPKKQKGIKSLSDQELKAMVARLQLEKQYKDLSRKDITLGKKIANDLLVQPAKTAIATQATLLIGKAIAKALIKVVI